MDPVKEAWNLIVQGRRHLVIRDYSAAVQSLEEGCKLLDSVYGVNADECGDAYFYYGLALFELARQEMGALNGVGDGNEKNEQDSDNEDEEGDDDQDDDEEEEEEAVEEMPSGSGMVTQADFEEDITRSPQANRFNDNNDMMMDDMDINQPSTSSGFTDADREAALDDDDNVSTLEISWEVLKLAKNVYERQLNFKNVHLNLAETVQKLGEIYIEWENFDEALKELFYSLEIRKQQLEPNHRLIAETFYHIGLAQSFRGDLEAAEKSFYHAVEVIENRLQQKKQDFSVGFSLDEETRSKLKAEIEELESLLPEMRFKVEDCQETRRNINLASNVVENDKLEEQKIAERARENQFRPVTNVTHLVKRKPDERDTSISKKLRSQNNGEHLMSSNGHSYGGQSYNGNDADDSMAMAD